MEKFFVFVVRELNIDDYEMDGDRLKNYVVGMDCYFIYKVGLVLLVSVSW